MPSHQLNNQQPSPNTPSFGGGQGEAVLKSLSIRITTDGLSFCVYAPTGTPRYVFQKLRVKPVVSLAANLKEALMTEPLLKQPYKRVNVLITTPQFTTVPAVAFEREHIEDTFRFVFPKVEHTHISYNMLRRSGIAVIFGFDKHLRQLIIDDFPRARFYASASTLIEFFSERSLIGTNRKMYAYRHDDQLTVYCFQQGRMLFVNSYPVHGINDCQYYLLGLWKELKYDQLEDALFVVSDDDGSKELVDKIHYFLRNVSLIDRSDDFRETITRGNSTIPYDLQTLLVCGF